MRHCSQHAVTLVEALGVIVILGIVLFLTLPHIANSKASTEKAAIKAKAAQLNIAKDAYIATNGIDPAQINWSAMDENGRWLALMPYLPPGSSTATTLNGTGGYSLPGYILAFSPSIGAPVLIYTDVNLDGQLQTTGPTPDLQLAY